MGVKEFWTIVAPVKERVEIAALKDLTLAVDLSIWVCEMQTARIAHFSTAASLKKMYLRNLFFRVSHLLQCGVKIIFVCDSKCAPDLKQITLQNRNNRRFKQTHYHQHHFVVKNSPKIKKKHTRTHLISRLKECCQLLDYVGVSWLESVSEAEATCAQLNAAGLCDGCLTDDSDAFLYGAKVVYRNYTMEGKLGFVERYRYSDIRDRLGVTRDDMVGLAVLLGCDYLPKGVPGVGKEHALTLLRAAATSGHTLLHMFDSWVPHQQDAAMAVSRGSHRGVSTQFHHCPECAGGAGQCHCTRPQRTLHATAATTLRDKCLKQPGFPHTQVISEYLGFSDPSVCNVKGDQFVWRRPSIIRAQEFMLAKLEWPASYTIGKVLPLVTLWDMLDILNDPTFHSSRRLPQHPPLNIYLKPRSIIKGRVKRGVKSYEVQWEIPAWFSAEDGHSNDKENQAPVALTSPITTGDDADSREQLFRTIEVTDIFEKAYPTLVDHFVKQQQAVQRKPRKKKTDVINDVHCVSALPPGATTVTDSCIKTELSPVLKNKPLKLTNRRVEKKLILQPNRSNVRASPGKSKTMAENIPVVTVSGTSCVQQPQTGERQVSAGAAVVRCRDRKVLTLEEIIELRLLESGDGVGGGKSGDDEHWSGRPVVSEPGSATSTPCVNARGAVAACAHVAASRTSPAARHFMNSPHIPLNCFKLPRTNSPPVDCFKVASSKDSSSILWDERGLELSLTEDDSGTTDEPPLHDLSSPTHHATSVDCDDLADSVHILTIADRAINTPPPPPNLHDHYSQQATPSMFNDTF